MSDHGNTQPDWDPRDPSVLADQRRAYDEMREQCPVAYSDAMSWSLFRHQDVEAVLMDPETFSNSSRHHAIPNAMNGPEHAVHRHLLEPCFSDERMDEVEPACREIATRAAEDIIAAGETDAVANLAEPVALQTMCRFLGWPVDTWTRVQAWIHGNQQATFARDRAAAKALAAEYAAMVKDALEAHRQAGADRDDVTSQLMATKVDGRQWTDEDIVDTLRNWIAGHGTVAGAISIVVYHLARNQQLQDRLRRDPGLIPAAIDELLRIDGPLVANRRTTTRDVTIDGRDIPSGNRISLMWIAANRDPHTFDDAASIRLDRDQQANLLFGAGIHYCLGAPLARLELRVVIGELLARTRHLALSETPSPLREAYPGNGFSRLTVQAS